MEAQQVRQTVVQRENDPYIYLYVMGEWYCYDPHGTPIGSGAMGDVYMGYRVKNGEQIAIKHVKDFYANTKLIRERAKQEASLAFRHPNLVEMIGYCEYAPDRGPIFLLSHLVKGQNINTYIKSLAGAPFRVEKISRVIMSILDALDYVHSRGVIHRDIKPANIMIEDNSNVRLMDLGISRLSGGNKFSSFGFIGTPQYSAPEQIKRDESGKGDPINATTDIYEVGITFYEMLTGVNPMDSPSEAEILDRQVRKPLPSHQMIPPRLMKVIWKATEKEQAKRYQSALDFKKAIADALAPEPPVTKKIALWVSEHAVIAGAAAVVIAAVIITLLLI